MVYEAACGCSGVVFPSAKRKVVVMRRAVVVGRGCIL